MCNTNAVLEVHECHLYYLSFIGFNSGIFLDTNSPGACSLLDHRRQATGSEYSSGVMSVPNLDPYDNYYKTTTYGISSLNDWHASSVHSNFHGGSDYTLVGFNFIWKSLVSPAVEPSHL